MSDTKKEIWNEPEEEDRRPKRHTLRNVLLLLLLLVLVLGVVVVAAYRDGTGFDVLTRYLNYGSVEKSSGDTVCRYDADADNRFASLGNRLVVLSSTALRLFDADGGEVWSANVKMTAPALTTGGGRAAAYDVGGRTLYVLDEKGELLHLTEEGGALIAASLNEKGMLAVTAQKNNYKGSVSVYDAKMEKIFEFNSSRRFVTDGCVTDDGKYLAAVTLGQENSTFVSNVVLYDLQQTEPAADYDITDGLAAVIREKDGQIVTVSDTCLTVADRKGTVSADYRYADEFLREYDLHGDGFMTLLLNRYRSGSVGRLVTLDMAGKELAALDVAEEVRSISAAGRYLAVLYNDRLVIYNTTLQTYATLHRTDYARDVLMRADGSALLLSAESAELFLP